MNLFECNWLLFRNFVIYLCTKRVQIQIYLIKYTSIYSNMLNHNSFSRDNCAEIVLINITIALVNIKYTLDLQKYNSRDIKNNPFRRYFNK